MRLLLLCCTVALTAAAPALAHGPVSTHEAGTHEASTGHANAQRCLQEPPPADQIFQSSNNPDLFYFATTHYHGHQEVNIGVLDASDCFVIAIPLADFLKQLQLEDNCAAGNLSTGRTDSWTDAAGATDGSSMRKLLQIVEVRAATSFTSFKPLLERKLAAAEETHGSSRMLADSFDAAAPPLANPQSPEDNSCSSDFLASLESFGFAQSTIASNWWYFTNQDLGGSGDMGLCMADFGRCEAECMDLDGFQYATGASVEEICQLAELSSEQTEQMSL